MSSSDAPPVAAALTVRRSRASAGWALLGSELAVLFRRIRTWAMLAALAAVPILIAVAVRITGGSSRGPGFLSQITDNGLFVAFTALVVCMPLFLPLTIGVVAGDTIAGEASHGTLRYLVIAPAGRLRLLAVKYAGAAAFSVAGALVVALAGAGIGAVLFPIGPVTLLSGTTVGVGEALLRMLLIAAFVVVSLLGLCAIGLFLSTLTDVPVGAMAATAVLAVVSQVLDQLPQLSALHPWLFSHYWLGFGDLLRDPISWDAFGQNALLQLGYVAVFGALAIGRFTSKDILS
ncbi:ABC transporter permease [Leifsonia naganoensis]|uniref:ABC-2 type transport system permease protein n=1 Tax=Leifsonia naganoensis TaxID=150025 RepID=A0A853DWR1_9MICO|nr:ABC transporter permease [Leifsonia naganoensis]NYK11634.1 ABC-2 type transport system permease protein [Leifsonia naganoensis]